MLSTIVRALLRNNLRGGGTAGRTLQSYRHRSDVITMKNKFGVRMHLDPFDYIDNFVVRHGYYESEIAAAIQRSIRDGDVFWDVGSNSGLHAVTIGALYPQVKVYAFEPSPREISRIQQNICANKLSNVTVVPWALSDHEFALKSFYLAKGNSGMNSFSAWAGEEAYTRTSVVAFSGDRLVRDGIVAPPNVLKIDVEGAELEVLNGLRAVLASGSCRTIIFESGDPISPGLGSLLEDFGYDTTMLNRMEPTAHNLENFLAERRTG